MKLHLISAQDIDPKLQLAAVVRVRSKMVTLYSALNVDWVCEIDTHEGALDSILKDLCEWCLAAINRTQMNFLSHVWIYFYIFLKLKLRRKVKVSSIMACEHKLLRS